MSLGIHCFLHGKSMIQRNFSNSFTLISWFYWMLYQGFWAVIVECLNQLYFSYKLVHLSYYVLMIQDQRLWYFQSIYLWFQLPEILFSHYYWTYILIQLWPLQQLKERSLKFFQMDWYINYNLVISASRKCPYSFSLVTLGSA